MKVNRIISYIDGFNLYFGLKDNNWKKYYWLDIYKLTENLLISNQQVERVKYFTARINGPADKARRQSIYLDALGTIANLDIICGHYLSNVTECKYCGQKHLDSKEKMTDVNIAVEMIADALDDKYDVAFLITADSDLVPAIKLIKKIYPQKRIVVCFPPKRHSSSLSQIADFSLSIFENRFSNSLLPDPIILKNGYQLRKPVEWQ